MLNSQIPSIELIFSMINSPFEGYQQQSYELYENFTTKLETVIDFIDIELEA